MLRGGEGLRGMGGKVEGIGMGRGEGNWMMILGRGRGV